jgi:hypothetical protein
LAFLALALKFPFVCSSRPFSFEAAIARDLPNLLLHLSFLSILLVSHNTSASIAAI